MTENQGSRLFKQLALMIVIMTSLAANSYYAGKRSGRDEWRENSDEWKLLAEQSVAALEQSAAALEKWKAIAYEAVNVAKEMEQRCRISQEQR